MPFSKNPNRYDPIYEYILMEMEKGTIEFELNLDTEKRCTNVKLTLYGYANAWLDAGQKAALRKDHSVAENCFAKHKTLTRYKLVQMGETLLCVSRDSGSFKPPKITIIRKAESEPETIGAEAAEEIFRETTQPMTNPTPMNDRVRAEFAALMDPSPKPHHGLEHPLEATEEDLNGPTSAP